MAILAGNVPRVKVSQRWAVAICLTLGLAYAFVVPAGLPYDEPSHWATVVYYAKHWSMPVLGHPGVTYEAQMGPVAYYVDAVLVHAVSCVGGGQSAQLHAVRVLGVMELAALVFVLMTMLRQLGVETRGTLCAAVVIAANPMLLTMSASVQNDTLALLLATACLGRLVTANRETTSGSAVVSGLLAGVAILTKLTVWPVAAVGLVYICIRSGWRRAAGMAIAIAATCGWWLIRNQVVYGDATARNAVRRAGVSFTSYHVHGVRGVGHLIEEVVTYLWLPTEYLRNEITAPTLLKALLLLVTIVVATLGVSELLDPRRSVVTCTAALAAVVWLVTFVAVQAAAFRTAYLVLPAWGLMIAGAASRTRHATAIVVTLMIGLNAWALVAVSGVSWPSLV